ncbi:MAG: MEKHLA domain-containing protein [Gammaproteobacteria bacterium]|nr:MEKHLA domain-containing protein [Gammaproteobacteria bacterium]
MNSRAQAELIFESYLKLLGKPLLILKMGEDLLEKMYFAPFAILSHGIEDDPVFNFANEFALNKFEMTWSEMIKLPSRFSAEVPNRQERKLLLDRVTEFGYIDDYQGVRVSSKGKRFMIKQAVVWNLIDEQGAYRGQAGMFLKAE